MAENKDSKSGANTAVPSKREVELQKKLNELEKMNKQLMEEKAQKEESTETTPAPAPGMAPEVAIALKNLQAEVDRLRNQAPQVITMGEKKEKYRPVSPDDWQEESIVFTARSILYVVGSYRDHKGVEILPPHQPIVFQYAASDIRKEGREDLILNYCQYTTNLKSEIDFLRSHPHFGIAFSENANQMMSEDVMDTQYKVSAASQVNAMSAQAIYERCKQYNIPYHSKRLEELRILIIHKMAEENKASAAAIKSEREKRMALAVEHNIRNKE